MTILFTTLSLSSIGILSAVILYFIAQKFKVIEDHRIDDVEELLPGANCGGCGYPGCRSFAEACVTAKDFKTLFCPVAGNEKMGAIAKYLGKAIEKKSLTISVVRCNGTHDNCVRMNQYDSALTCAIASFTYGGETGCAFGCLGLGDCVAVCKWDAIKIDSQTGLPFVDETKCTACGACALACPRNIIELRNKGPKNRRIFVSCMNQDRGAAARKACRVACIGCMKCVKVCEKAKAITVENFLAYIDFDKCILCRKCVQECPTGAIHEINFSPRKPKLVPEKKELTQKESKPASSDAVTDKKDADK